MKTRRRTPASPVARRTSSRWLSAAVLLAVAACATVAIRAQVGTQVVGGDEANPNYDIRAFKQFPRPDDVRDAADYLARYDAQQRADRLVADRLDGAVQLAAAVPGVRIDDHVSLGTTEVVSVAPGGAFLTAEAPDREATLRGFLATYPGVYGLAANEVADLSVVSNYLNPGGNMGWVELEQRFNGIPVFQGRLRGGFTAKGQLAGTTGVLAAGIVPEELTDAPAVQAEQAVALAASSVGWKVTEPALTRKSAVNGKVTLGGPGMAGDATAWLVYFPLKAGVVRLAWATQIMGDPDAFLTVLDADDGTMLFRKNLTNYQTQSATYNVYTSDSPAPSSPTTILPGSGTQAPFVARSSQTLIGNEGATSFNNLGWITDGANGGNGHTDGNNVEAGLDVDGTNGVDAPVAGTARVFNFAYDPAVDAPTTANYRNGDVTNMFYWVNRYHDLTYLLGFTEASFNFQNDNFGRGGLGADRVSAETQDANGCQSPPCFNNANFSTPADGGRGRMQMFVWNGPTPNRSGGLDQDIIIHELTHGLSNRLHGNATGLSTNMSRGIGEGWSDFYARSLLATSDENANGLFPVGGWATNLAAAGFTDNYYYGIRRFPYAVRSNVGANGRPHSPLTFADIDSMQADLTDGAFPRGPLGVATVDQVHNIGEVWGGMLWEVRARFITRLGFPGNQRFLQIVTDGMKLNPAGPTMLQARNSIIAAANAGAGTPAERAADVADIWAGFATRGMGISAQITNAGSGAGNTRVVEAFDIPGVNGTTATLASESIPNGRLDPGEFVGVSFCMTNSGAATSGAVTGSLFASGGVLTPSAPQSFGTIAPGANACRTFTFVVSGACGASVTPSLQSVEAGGTTKTFVYAPLEIGGIVSFFAQNFDGVVAPALPAGWTTSTLSGTANLWATNVTAPDTAPNRAFASALATVSDNELVSPTIALAAGVNRLTFRNSYVTEDSWDGGVLELKIGAGAFQDVIVAGGAFVAGGYNLTLNASANPIAGRMAWSGNSGGYVTTSVNLPLAAGGQNVQLRWRLGSDASVAATGWAVDTINIGVFTCAGASGPAPVAVNDTYAVAFNTPLSVFAPGVLTNDTGTGPLTALVGANVTHGALALAADGSFTYTPTAGYIGPDSFTYRAVNAGGPGNTATVSLTVNAPTSAQPPNGLRVSSMVGNVVTFRWDPPAIGPAATGFVLEAGLTPGTVLASLPLGAVPSFTIASPSASYFVRIHTLAGADRSAASNEIAVHVGVPVPPSAPANLLATVAGDSLTLAWTNTFGGAAPTGLVVDVSGAVSGSLPIGVSDTFAVAGIPAGTYTLSLRAVNGAGVSPSSNAVTVTFPGACSGAPLPPANFLAFNTGNTLFLGWDTAATGPAPSSFVIGVTGSFVGSVPIGGREISGAVPPGTYHVSLQAVNVCGGSAFTAAQTVVVP